MGLLSLFKNINLGFGMTHIPTDTSAGTMEAKVFKEVKQDTKVQLGGDLHEVTGVDKDTIIRNDETGSCEFGMDWQFNHPLREEEKVAGKLEEAVGRQRRLAKFELNFLGLPIRPGEKKCPFYMRTGGCKFASRCRFHHPDPAAVVGGSFQDPKNGVPSQHHGPVEQLCETPRPSENTSNELTEDSFTPNLKLQQPVHRNEDQTTTCLLHPREMNINDQQTALAYNDTACEFNGGVESHQFEEYPQRPHEPKCQHFMKTGYCKFKSACRYHHPKSNVSFLGLPQRLVSNNYQVGFHQPVATTLLAEDSRQHQKSVASSQICGPGLVEQLRETPFPSENTSNEQAAFLRPSSSYAPDLVAFNQGLKPNTQSNGNLTVSSLLHPPEIKIIGQQKELANKDAAYEFSGVEPQRYDEYPQKPSEPNCQYFMKTGYCKFKSACRYHHPKSNLSFLGLPLRSASEIYEQDDPVEQLCEMPLPSAKSPSNDHRAVLYSSSFNVPGLLTPNQGIQPISWNGGQTVTCLLHPPEIKSEKQQELANGDAAYEFSGVEPLQYDEYPQRPSEPECQYFMKTGYCKFKSTCRYHHPKSNLSFLGLPLRPACNNYAQDSSLEQMCELPLPSENVLNAPKEFLCSSPSNVPGLFTPNQGLVTPNQGLQSNAQWNGDQIATSPLHLPEIKIDEKGQKLANKDTAYEFNGGVKSQQLDEYPQRPNEPECKHFTKTGYCKFKSACRCHHPKPNPSFPAPSLNPDKPICTRYIRRGICKFGSACRYSHHMEHT